MGIKGNMENVTASDSNKDNFVHLLLALSLLLLSTAIAQQFYSVSAQRLVQSATVITLLIGVWGIKLRQIKRSENALFILAILASSFSAYWFEHIFFEYLRLLVMLLFFIFTAGKITKKLLFTGTASANKIVGAICLYLLLGLIWALLYTLNALAIHEAFTNIENQSEWYLLFPDFIYFSFVTLTTLGFGDITPSSPMSKFLVYAQAVFGQFYLAILVSTLVSSFQSQKQQAKQKSK